MTTPEAEEFAERFDVSRETLDKLLAYEVLLKKWNPAINLVAKSTLEDMWSRHFLDSAQIFAMAPENAQIWADFGAGGGFPGLVIAVLSAEKEPERQVALVESDLRKSAFLSTVSRELSLNTRVIAQRIEEIGPLDADVVSARALASLPKLLEFTAPHLKPDGTALFPKGARWQEELAQARESWSFDHEAIESLSDPNSVVLKIHGAERV
ncbi:16S rRNA (guanine(527)-N(7))-methyltransferase RsmG [Thioclava nitratireducens]|uniref:16S rRNA (guanine(527)-N(7))-methyltransferase RsmG n=1 Tax=Thioclava nitratireducens TaxID=1915078 RepID=UPI00248018C6|nr:16S rRNA (guanine(527)-N(7))-methyltransferase RsmG [Thioclava nitratireducens]WGT51994.1 16S rRNA (guanine(527)-N(7))-methyltransferase RsmG [Thioclava nitratireducens]